MGQKAAFLVLAAACLAPSVATAQPDQPDQPEPATEPAGPAEPARIPEVSDPMLVELRPAKNVLTSWQQALRMTRNQSTSLRSVAARVQQASAQSRQALARALPTLTGTASITHHLLYGEGPNFSELPIRVGSIPDPGTTWQAGLQLRVPVFAPQAWHDYGTAKKSVAATRLSAKDTERLVLASVADSIVSAVTAERLAEVSRVSLRSALSTLDLNRRRARLGAASAVDVLRAEQEVALTRQQVVQANEGLRRAREALGLALGSSEPWGVTPNIQLDQLAGDAKNACRPEQDIGERADIRAARLRVEVARRGVESVDWAYLPTVDFVSNLTYFSHDDFTPNREHVTWTVGGVLTWQLYDGGLRSGQREASEAEVQLAQEDLTAAKRQARTEISQAYRAVQVAEANLAVSERSRRLARESSRLARIAFINGSGTSFELVDTARRLREAELDRAIKEFEVLRAKITALLALASCEV